MFGIGFSEIVIVGTFIEFLHVFMDIGGTARNVTD